MDVFISKCMHTVFTSNKILNQTFYVMGVIPYKLIVYFGTLFALFYTLLLGSRNSLRLIIFPMCFASAIMGYLEVSIHRIRPGCRYRKLSNTLDPNSCDGFKAFNSMPCRQTLMFAAVVTSIVMYLQDTSISNENKMFLKIPFYKKWVTQMVIGVLITLLIITSMERIIDGYNYFTDVIFGLGLGFVIGYTSFKICSEAMNQNIDDLRWMSMRFLGCLLCLFVIIRYVINTIPAAIRKRAYVMKPTYFRRVTTSPIKKSV